MPEEFTPPIRERSDDELIIIAHSSAYDWQQAAIDQAKAELLKRGITKEHQKKRLNELNAEAERELELELENRKLEDFNTFEKVWMVLFWWRYILFWGWNFKKDGYLLKAKRRWQLLGIGVIAYFLLFLWAYEGGKAMERKRTEEMNQVDSK